MAVAARDVLSAGRSASADAYDEIVRRAAAIAHGTPVRDEPLGLPGHLVDELEAAEHRARALVRAGGGCEQSRHAAALELLAEAISVLRLVESSERGEVRAFVSGAAAAMGVSRGAANLLVFMRCVNATAVARLAPELAIEYVLDLLVELGPAEAVSLWRSPRSGRLERLAAAGESAETRRVRTAARLLLENGEPALLAAGSHVRAVPVVRWDSPHAALVARARPEATGRLLVYLTEAAQALSPVLEHGALYEASASRERALVSGSERWAARLGCDLHDGPLQELVALASDLHLVRAQVGSLVAEPERARVAGRFDDLDARLQSLDSSLRGIAQSARATSALDRPLVQALQAELDRFACVAGVNTSLVAGGELGVLTNSQKIVFLRVLQEALSNVRRHSGAGRVEVVLRATRRYVSLLVADDGCGFDVADATRRGRLGLTGVVERVRLLGGDVEITSELDSGTRILVTLPRWSLTKRPTGSAPYAAIP